MMREEDLVAWLGLAKVDPAVFELRPDYRVMLLAVSGIVPGSSDPVSGALLQSAEEAANALLADQAVDQLPHIAAWRDGYRGFGAKPQRTRNSLEALTRRAPEGLPRINRLTDTYNAISVLHQVPLGGEDLDRYDGPPRLIRATGGEPFDTIADGEVVIEHPEPGEIVWIDDSGVTCRRWNWRQCRRTQLTESTTSAIFIFDALASMTDVALSTAGDQLLSHLTRISPEARIARRLIGLPARH